MASTLIDRLRQADQLPTAPGVALRIVELNRQDDVDIDQLTALLGQDPALAARVIKTANSSMFGIPREVTSLRQAVLVLGLRTVNLLALSFSVLATTKGGARADFSYPEFWTQTGACAMGMRILAEKTAKRLCDEAFLVGLLCQFGRLVLAECAPAEYGAVLTRLREVERPLFEIEREELDTDYAELGGQLLDTWGLPADVCLAIRYHLEPHEVPEGSVQARRLAEIANVAACCASILTGAQRDSDIEGFVSAAESFFAFDRSTCNDVLIEIQQALPLVGETLGLDIEDEAQLLEIRQRATELLLRESLALQHQVKTVHDEMGELEREKAELKQRARTDALTGLLNRGCFDQTLEAARQAVAASETSVGLLLIDLDHFKRVNDEHGHAAGDALLRAAADAVVAAVGSRGECFRYGGEELAVICRGLSVDRLRALSEQVRTEISARRVQIREATLSRTASVGGCWAPAGLEFAATSRLLELADRQLYAAKDAGRDVARVDVLQG